MSTKRPAPNYERTRMSDSIVGYRLRSMCEESMRVKDSVVGADVTMQDPAVIEILKQTEAARTFYTLNVITDGYPILTIPVSDFYGNLDLERTIMRYRLRGSDYDTALADRVLSEKTIQLVLYINYVWNGGSSRRILSETMLDIDEGIGSLDSGEEAFGDIIQISGIRKSPWITSKIIHLRNIYYLGIYNGKYNVRSAVNMYVRPGARIIYNTHQFNVESMMYSITTGYSYMNLVGAAK
jgi:hypothetical protein